MKSMIGGFEKTGMAIPEDLHSMIEKYQSDPTSGEEKCVLLFPQKGSAVSRATHAAPHDCP